MYNILEVESPALVAEMMTRLYDRGMTTPSGGNLSVLDEQRRLWVTPSQIDKGKLSAADIVCIAEDGSFSGKHKPTMEYLFHQAIYQVREDVRAVIHAHAPALVSMSMMEEIPEFGLVPSLMDPVDAVGFSSYALPGSSKLGTAVKTAFKKGVHAILMENHGTVTTGRNLLEAFHRLENLEHSAKIYFNALRLGKGLSATETAYQELIGANPPAYEELKKHAVSDAENAVRKALLECLKRCYLRGLCTASAGAVSCRNGHEGFLTSPANMDIRYLGAGDFICIESERVQKNGVPSHYWPLHQEIFKQHPEIECILCLQPASVMAFAVSPSPFETRTIPESYMMLRKVEKTELSAAFQHPEETAALITGEMPNLLISHDCMLTTGNSLFQVFDRMEVAEFTAASLISASSAGSIRCIDDKKIKEIGKKFF